MKSTFYTEPLAGGFAAYSTASGKLEMVGFQKPDVKIAERQKLFDLVAEGAKRLQIPVWQELDEDYESLVITFGPKDDWGLIVFPTMALDEDIDGSATTYPAFDIEEWWKTPMLRQTEEKALTKSPAGLVTALRIILRWLYDNHRGDVVEGVVQEISPKE